MRGHAHNPACWSLTTRQRGRTSGIAARRVSSCVLSIALFCLVMFFLSLEIVNPWRSLHLERGLRLMFQRAVAMVTAGPAEVTVMSFGCW